MKKKIIIIASVVTVLAIGIASFFIFFNKNNKEESKTTSVIENIYFVSFNTDGGTKINDIKVKENDTFDLPEDPTKEGYTFTGWTNNGETYVSGTKVVDDLELTATWVLVEAKTYKITFNTDGGNKISSMNIEVGKKVKLPTPTKKGYTFEYWVNKSNKKITNDDLTNNDKDINLLAIWKKDEVKETEKTTVTTTTTKQVVTNKIEEPVKEITYTCPEGYKLDGTKCTKNVSVKAQSTNCPSGTSEINGKCVTVTNSARVEATKKCPSKIINTGGGYTPSVEGQLKFAGYNYCVYGVVSDSYEQQSQSNCTSRNHVWVASENKCYYEQDTNYSNSCSSGYTYVSKPTDYGATIGGGCFPVADKPNACPDSSYKLTTDPYIGKMCSKTETIDATKN